MNNKCQTLSVFWKHFLHILQLEDDIILHVVVVQKLTPNILTSDKRYDIIQALSRTAGRVRPCLFFCCKEENAMYRVLKRDGVTVDFEITKISGYY